MFGVSRGHPFVSRKMTRLEKLEAIAKAARELLEAWPEHSPGDWSWSMRSPDPADDKLANAVRALTEEEREP